MDRTFIIIYSTLILFHSKTDRFAKLAVLVFNKCLKEKALKGFSDSLTTSDNNWETSMGKVIRWTVKGFRELKSQESRKDNTGEKATSV